MEALPSILTHGRRAVMKNRVALVAAAATSLLLAGGWLAVSTASAAAAGCSATYTVAGQWQGGFQGGVSFTNLGDPLTSWKLEFDFPAAGQTVSQGWNATWSQSGSHVTASNAAWNGAVATGGAVALGFIGTITRGHPPPLSFRLHRIPCTRPPPPPPTPPST